VDEPLPEGWVDLINRLNDGVEAADERSCSHEEERAVS